MPLPAKNVCFWLIHAGLARARAEGKHLGRRRTPGATDAAILTLREQGLGILKIGRKLRCGTARVQATLRAALLMIAHAESGYPTAVQVPSGLRQAVPRAVCGCPSI